MDSVLPNLASTDTVGPNNVHMQERGQGPELIPRLQLHLCKGFSFTKPCVHGHSGTKQCAYAGEEPGL